MSSKFFKKVGKVIGGILILFFLIPPTPSHAILGVGDQVFDIETEWNTFDIAVNTNFIMEATMGSQIEDTANGLKEYVGDGLAKMVGQMLIRKLTADVIGWINNDFKGKPAFINNPTGFLTETADSVMGEYLFGTADGRDTPLSWLCSPFALDIKINLAKRTYDYQDNQKCKLSEAISNIKKSVSKGVSISTNTTVTGGVIAKGGGGTTQKWGLPPDQTGNNIQVMAYGDFMNLTMDPNQNAAGSMLTAEYKVATAVNKVVDNINVDLNRGGGFLSFQSCVKTEPAQCLEYDNSNTSFGAKCLKYSTPKCSQYETKTPGSVVQTFVDQHLTSGTRQLEMADEINEIFAALANFVIRKLVGGAQGLLGMSSGNDSIGNFNANQDKYDQMKAQQMVDNYTAMEDAKKNEIASATQNKDTKSNVNPPTNLALGKAVGQSSTANGSSPVNANDGVQNEKYSATNSENQPWWQVDLGSSNMISSVNIWRRADVTANESLNNFKVQILNNDQKIIWESSLVSNPNLGIPYKQKVLSALNISALTSQNSGVGGRFVRIIRQDTAPLQLSEVEVMGNPITLNVYKLNTNNIDIYKNSAYQDRDVTIDLAFKSNTATDGYHVISGLIQINNNGQTVGAPLNNFFTDLSTKIEKLNTITQEIETVSALKTQDLNLQTMNIGENVSFSANIPYKINITGQLQDFNSLPIGNYILRTEIRNADDSVAGNQDILFNVSSL